MSYITLDKCTPINKITGNTQQGYSMSKFKPIQIRLLFIDRELKKGRFPNCSTLAEKWEGVSTKTIQRDIEYLKYQMNAPIDYNSSKKGYYYTEEKYSLPAFEVNESDLFAICIAEKTLKQYENTPIYEKLKNVYEKIENILPDKVSIRPYWLDTRFSFREEPVRKINDKIWQHIFEGLRQQRILKILYNTPKHDGSVMRTVEPYHVLVFRGEWYLIGLCREVKAMRTYALSRMLSVETGKEDIKIPEDFDINASLKDRFGMFEGSKIYNVKLLFDKDQAAYVMGREWHPSQKARPRKDEKVIIEFTVNHLFEIKRWVMAWGKSVTVSSPKELKEMIIEELKSSLGNYS